MQIFIQNKGSKEGPLTLDQVKGLIRSGQISLSDLGWAEGMPEWKPLSSFPELQSVPNPPPIPIGAIPPPFPTTKTEPLAVWSMVLGIVAIVGCSVGGFVAAIPGVICGHVGLSRIKRNPGLTGGKMAVSGLIMGYLAIVLLPVMAALAIPAVAGALERGKATQMLSNCRQIQLAVQAAQLDGTATGNPRLGYPATVNITSKAALKEMLVANHYLTAEDLERLGFEEISVANVADGDPPDTIFLKAMSSSGRSVIIFRKGGDGGIYRVGRDIFAPDPPRSPVFLE
jgi:type II secretory pathway pseudopilin PulG